MPLHFLTKLHSVEMCPSAVQIKVCPFLIILCHLFQNKPSAYLGQTIKERFTQSKNVIFISLLSVCLLWVEWLIGKIWRKCLWLADWPENLLAFFGWDKPERFGQKLPSWYLCTKLLKIAPSNIINCTIATLQSALSTSKCMHILHFDEWQDKAYSGPFHIKVV